MPCFTGSELIMWLCGYISAHPDIELKADGGVCVRGKVWVTNS